HARTPNDLVAAVHEDLRRRVIELRRVHRANDGQLVSDRREVRQQLREVCARLAARLELIRRADQSRRAVDESETLALDEGFGNLLAVQLGKLRLVIEEVEL